MLTRIDEKSIRARRGLPFFRAKDRSTSEGVGRSGAQILWRPTGELTESGGGMEGPVGVAQQLAAEQHEVGFSFSHDCVGLNGFGNHAHGCGGNASLAADSGGKVDLESGADGDLGVRNLSTRGNVNEIDAVLAQELGELDGFIDGPAAGNPVSCGEADKERQVVRPLGADGVNNGEKQTDSILKAASVSIRALVGERREELVEQVTVGGMNLDHVEASLEGAASSQNKSVDDGGDAGLVESLGWGVVGREGQGAGRDSLPAALGGQERAMSGEGSLGAGLAAGMGQLNGCAGALRVNELNNSPESGNVSIAPKPEITGGDAALGKDSGGFQDDQAGATLNAATQVDEVPISGEAVPRRVLAHGRDTDAVGKAD